MDEAIVDSVATEAAEAGGDIAAETAQAEIENTAAAAISRFGSVEALAEAFYGLEAQNTRLSERISELEKTTTDEALLDAARKRDKIKDAIVGDYLRTVFSRKCVPLSVEGVACAAPQAAPRTFKEAGALAKRFLND